MSHILSVLLLLTALGISGIAALEPPDVKAIHVTIGDKKYSAAGWHLGLWRAQEKQATGNIYLFLVMRPAGKCTFVFASDVRHGFGGGAAQLAQCTYKQTPEGVIKIDETEFSRRDNMLIMTLNGFHEEGFVYASAGTEFKQVFQGIPTKTKVAQFLPGNPSKSR